LTRVRIDVPPVEVRDRTPVLAQRHRRFGSQIGIDHAVRVVQENPLRMRRDDDE